MEWREGVTITNTEEAIYELQLGSEVKQSLPQHAYLFEAIRDGTKDDLELVGIVMEQERICEMAARFGLAEFLIEYAYFIAEDTGFYEIT